MEDNYKLIPTPVIIACIALVCLLLPLLYISLDTQYEEDEVVKPTAIQQTHEPVHEEMPEREAEVWTQVSSNSVSINWACSINAVCRYEDKYFNYDYATNFTTDGESTHLYKTTKFLGNYGVQPISILPPTVSAADLIVDLSQYLEEEDYDITKSANTDYEWYFLMPNDLRVNSKLEGAITLNSIRFLVKVDKVQDPTTIELQSSTPATDTIQSMHIVLRRIEGEN